MKNNNIKAKLNGIFHDNGLYNNLDYKKLMIAFFITIIFSIIIWKLAQDPEIRYPRGPKFVGIPRCLIIDLGNQASESKYQGLYNFGYYLRNSMYDYGMNDYEFKNRNVRVGYGKFGIIIPVDFEEDYEFTMKYYQKPLVKGDIGVFSDPIIYIGPDLHRMKQESSISLDFKDEFEIMEIKGLKVNQGVLYIVIDNNRNMFENGYYGLIIDEIKLCRK